MGEFSKVLIERSGYEEDGFADVYDLHRPAPPEALLDILTFVARIETPRLVVDLGSGTGLSTRVWADRAEEVVGIEPNARMAERARLVTQAPNIRYVEAFASETSIASGSADVATCSQAFHWMEPGPVLAEAARILRPGGVFAAYDYDVPPLVDPDVDAAFLEHFAARRAARARLMLVSGGDRWPKAQHLEQIRNSGLFRLAREVLCHGFDETDAARVAGMAESMGGPRALFSADAPEVEATFEQLARTAHQVLGDRTWPMVVCYRIRLGVK
jgi:ubiquinone/menaquinone biosynthesis C-methylase UbiE